MWKLIDCGTYPWFVMQKQKYFHCVYSLNGEYKKLITKFYKKLENSSLKELIISDSVPKIKSNSKIKMLSCADLFADVMHRVHNNESISSKFIM